MSTRTHEGTAEHHGFYVEPDCCLLCGVPEDISPELFRTGEKSCYFLKQPCSPQEIHNALEAMGSSEVDCIRYGGSDVPILKRIGEAGMASLADDPRAAAFPRVIRDRVSFSIPGSPRASELASSLRAHVRANDGFSLGRSFRRNKVRFAWWGMHFHSVTFQPANGETHTAVLAPAIPGALQGVARVVDEWLRSSGAGHVVWHTRETSEGIPAPF